MRNLPGLVLTAVLLASQCTLAQNVGFYTPPPDATKGPLPGGSISGHVLCTDTRAPARGARIMVMPARFGVQEPGSGNAQPLIAVTTLDGSFHVAHVPPGEYFILALAAGYLTPLSGMMAANNADPAELKAMEKAMETQLREKAPTAVIHGREDARVEIELQRGAIVSGKVVYSDGSPASQLPVLLQNADPPKRESKQSNAMDAGILLGGLYLRQSPNTDDQGHFRISGLAEGRYRLAVLQTFEVGIGSGAEMLSQFIPGLGNKDKLTVYSGNTLHQKNAKIYELHPGDTVDDVEIVLPLTGLHSIQGIATSKDGAPLNFGVLNLSDSADPAINFHANIRQGGEFRFSGIPEGTYELKITQGFIFNNPPNFELRDNQVSAIGFVDQFKPLRAFAETEIPVIMQATDINDLAVTLADTKLPERAGPASDPETSPNTVVTHPH